MRAQPEAVAIWMRLACWCDLAPSSPRAQSEDEVFGCHGGHVGSVPARGGILRRVHVPMRASQHEKKGDLSCISVAT